MWQHGKKLSPNILHIIGAQHDNYTPKRGEATSPLQRMTNGTQTRSKTFVSHTEVPESLGPANSTPGPDMATSGVGAGGAGRRSGFGNPAAISHHRQWSFSETWWWQSAPGQQRQAGQCWWPHTEVKRFKSRATSIGACNRVNLWRWTTELWSLELSPAT